MTTVAERIQQRLDALNKTASGVAIEAGMGRSSVRDILNGKAANPRLDTLRKLTVPLQCSLAFLTGQSDEVEMSRPQADRWFKLDASVEPLEDRLEAGAFHTRPNSWNYTVTGNKEGDDDSIWHVRYGDMRLPTWGVFNYEVGDNSMGAVGIVRGDIVSGAAHAFDAEIELRHGRFVIVRHRLMQAGVEEGSLREVSISEDGSVTLVSKPLSGEVKPIAIRRPKEGEETSVKSTNLYISDVGGEVRIEALAVRFTRNLEI